MVPKFKGNSEDWLDNEEESENASRSTGARATQAKKAARQDRAKILPFEESNAVVAEVFPNQCRVRMIGTGPASDLLCSYRRANVIKSGSAVRERSPVAVGDRVKVERIGSASGIVDAVCERRNYLSRPAPGRENTKIQHVIAANVDELAIVVSVKEPDFSPGLVDRYLVAAAFARIEPVICLTKLDLLLEGAPRPADLYRKLGYTVFEVSAKLDWGLDALRKRFENKTVVFSGPSGVGKTSLLRKLLGSEVGRVGEVSAATGKGRHTTTGAVLLGGPSELTGQLTGCIDTPGVREFGLGEIPPADLASLFVEFRNLSCDQQGCLHLDEEGCAARDLERYPSYRRILESLLAGEN
ncbi:MAG: ribosome small subunit-dependent GTPase A [Oligoflexia bacterium]|nr:ribosome small subunit-dependent GTPase A [Oligoflexia bacterium]